MLQLETPVGLVSVHSEKGCITAVYFTREREYGPAPSAVERAAAKQIEAYFAKELRKFDLPLFFSGTPFQESVWRELLKIPYGETRSYGEIARAVGRPGGARAAGMACNRNRIALVIPCHRVIGASGALTGFAPGVEIKQLLLDLEKKA